MDLRLGRPGLGPLTRPRILVRPEEGLRVVMERAPQAEALAARWIEKTRPVWSWFAREWRRVGTVAALLIIAGVVLHAMFGANGVVAYKQKKAEMEALQAQVDHLQKENAQAAERIRLLKSDPAAIEKEAREQLHYTRKGEIIFVAPDPPQKPPTVRAKKDK